MPNSPQVNAATPYSDYGSLGQYFISGTVAASSLKPDFAFTTSGLTAAYTDTSTDGDGAVNSWSWRFGDGGSSVEQNPSHTYAASGSFTVTLAVTDTLGGNAATSRVVTVTLPNLPPVADFTFSTTGQTADFTDASYDSDGSIVSRSWSFGDGGSSTLSNPSHVYGAGGSYTVALTVTDSSGASDGVQKVVALTIDGLLSRDVQ